MTTNLIQPSFAAGELSPFLYGRVDLAKFHIGARTMLNFLVHPHGGASNRPGTRFVGEVDDSSKRHRLIPFCFRASPAGQNYALVFGDFTMQVVMFNGTTWGFVETSPGSGVRFTMATPYALTDLPTLKYVQSADTMTLTHSKYAPRKLTRTGHAAWQLTAITFAPVTPAPQNLTVTSGTGSVIVVTAINDGNGEESLPSAASGSGSSFNWTAVAGCTNYNIYKAKGSIYGFVAQVNTNSWTDSNLNPDVGNTPPQARNPFGLGTITAVAVKNGGSGYSSPNVIAVDQSGSGATFTAHVSGGAITSVDVNTPGRNYSLNTRLQVSDGGGSGAALQLNWAGDFNPDPDAPATYHVDSVTVLAGGSGYHAGAYAIVIAPEGGGGAALSLSVSAGAIVGCTVANPGAGYHWYFVAPYVQVFDGNGSGAVLAPTITSDPTTFPQCSTYYQQRQVYAATLALPQTLWFSVVGAFNNMSVSSPTKDDDAITRALTGLKVNEVRHLVPAGTNMLVMTSGAEWRCWPGPSANALTPGSCMTLLQSTYGTSHVPPIWSGKDLLFVQERGSRVRALEFDVLQDQYQSSDMSVLSQHLLYDTGAQYQIQEWAFAEEPFRVVWSVRSDGAMLGFTWMPEHQVFAWHRHVTDGKVESVCTIPEPDGAGGYIDAVYLIVNRTINGQTKRYVERMVDRVFVTIADAWFVDCGLQYSGAPVMTVSGLDHLEGKTVAILADGSVVPSQVVSGAAITLDGSYSKVTVGLSYTADLATLDLELPSQSGTVQGRPKKIAQATVRVKDARGIQIGIEQEVAIGSAGGVPALIEIKQRSSETLGFPMQPFSGDWQVTIPTEWNRGGRLFIRQSYPLPVTILAIVPEVSVGD